MVQVGDEHPNHRTEAARSRPGVVRLVPRPTASTAGPRTARLREDRIAMGLPAWWAQRRYGLLVHGSLASVPAWAPIGQYAEWYRAHSGGPVRDVLMHPAPMVETLAHHRDRWAHIEHPDDFFPFLTFDEYDPDAWCGLARDAGMGYAVMVAKHHDGLCWWDAPGTDRTVLHDGPARNVLGQFAAACERADLVFGTYYSLLDWADPRYPSSRYVDEAVHPQVLDLVERYGSKMLWGDGHWGGGGSHWRSNELIAAAREIDPEIVVNDRWWSDGPGVRSFEYRLPGDVVGEPWETRRGLGGSFGWNRAEGPDHLMTAADLVALLTEVVAKGGHLLIAVGPDAQGRVPELHAERLRAAGGWVRRHRELVDRGEPWERWGDADCRLMVVDGVVHGVDVSGRGRFADLTPQLGRVRRIEQLDGVVVDFEQGSGGVSLRRPPRRSQRLPQVYRFSIDAPPEAPIALFPEVDADHVDLADLVADAGPGAIVQLGEGTYLGPARVPEGVTVRGLGPGRTRIDGLESCAVTLAPGARLEHCTVDGGGRRIAWLPRITVAIPGDGAAVLGCHIGGHVEVTGSDARVVSCVGNGVLVRASARASIQRCQFSGMQWDWAVEIHAGAGHLVESCEFDRLLGAIRLDGTVGAVVRGNRCRTRWWGVQAIDTDGTHLSGNSFDRVMRAIDLDGGTGAEMTGNAAIGGDSGCVAQRGATDAVVTGNRWERTRIGLLRWGAGDIRHRDNTCVDLGDADGELVDGP
jgi:alpha-L-fucosidase